MERTRPVATLTEAQLRMAEFYTETFGAAVTRRLIFQTTQKSKIEKNRSLDHEHLVLQLEICMEGQGVFYFYGTLGEPLSRAGRQGHQHHFVSLIDADLAGMANVLGFARMHNDEIAVLDDGHTFLLDECDFLRKRGYSNVFVARADFYVPFRGRADVVVNGVPTRVLALLPLENAEFRAKVERGAEAMFDLFQSEGRDILTLNPEP